ncbi:hypothetical protein BTM25_46120 [Actinomadura rubteroloni]|uniref:DUF397 domain-containing protein n=1 Tax=Actinomadura rubteroloni TaxID=1926885 RepID=A0A2P4UEI5_9ACTN|nr:DUF397 domain-containing protein [Actinomadura rubteroloni]POM23459.1 hypothetical protein BTM25_46120 [Actinomadura rubteroloni]
MNWRKSTHSSQSDCVEAAPAAAAVVVRDSADPGGPRLRVGARGWRTLLERARSGALDLPA